MSKQQDILIQELVSCRDYLMRQLEDLAEQEGRDKDKLGWQWLREHQKYPSKRIPPRGKLPTILVVKKYQKVDYWGWSSTQSPISTTGDTDDTLLDKDISQAERAGPTILPWMLSYLGFIKTTPKPSPEECLILAAGAMGKALWRLQPKVKE